MTAFSRGVRLLFAALLLACAPAAAFAQDEITVSLDVPEQPVVPWSTVEGSVTVIANEAVALSTIIVSGQDGIELARWNFATTQAASIDGDICKLSGKLEIDDPGPQARMPMPPRWSHSGDAQVVLVDHWLRADDEWTGTFSFCARYGVAPHITCKVACVVIDAQHVRQLIGVSAEHLPTGDTFGQGMVPVFRYTATYRGDRAGGLAGAPLMDPVALPSAPGVAQLTRYAVTADDWSAADEIYSTEVADFRTWHFTDDLDLALQRIAVSRHDVVEFDRLVAEEAWAIRTANYTWLVPAIGLAWCAPGNLMTVLKSIENRRFEVAAGEPDDLRVDGTWTDEFLTRLEEEGFELEPVHEKDGSLRVMASVEGWRVMAFAEICAEFGKGIFGTDLRELPESGAETPAELLRLTLEALAASDIDRLARLVPSFLARDRMMSVVLCAVTFSDLKVESAPEVNGDEATATLSWKVEVDSERVLAVRLGITRARRLSRGLPDFTAAEEQREREELAPEVDDMVQSLASPKRRAYLTRVRGRWYLDRITPLD